VLMLVENLPFLKDVRVFQEATALAENEHQVSVICQNDSNKPWRETVGGIHVFRYPAPLPGGGFLGYLWEYGYSLVAMFLLSLVALRNPGFDIIHASNPPDIMVFIGAFYKLFGKRFIFDHHDLAPELYQVRFGDQGRAHRLTHRILMLLEKISCRLADHIIATNQSFKKIEMNRCGVPEERITIVRNGPDLDRLALTDPVPEIQKKGKTILGYLGTVGFQDGVDVLLNALAHLTNELKRNNYFCMIAGGGDALPSLKLQARELGLDDFVVFTGWIKPAEVAKYISTADICLTPEPPNRLNRRLTIIKVMEYMALGKPVVAFDMPEHRVTAQDAAVYADPNDELDFAHKIAFLMDDPEKRAAMGNLGLKRIKENLAWHHQKEHLFAAYSTLSAQS